MPATPTTQPPHTSEEFERVLLDGRSEVLVRELLIKFVPAEVKAQIVAAFYEEMREREAIREGE